MACTDLHDCLPLPGSILGQKAVSVLGSGEGERAGST